MLAAGDEIANLGTIYDDTVRLAPERTAVIDATRNRSVTYREFANQVARSGNALGKLGVEAGDRVTFFFPNELAYLYAYFGAMRLGAVPVPVNVELFQEAIEHVVSDSGASVVLTSEDPDVRGRAETAAESVPEVRTLAVSTTEAHAFSEGVRTVAFEDVRRGASTDLAATEVDFKDPMLQPYTSGSTGVPKGVVLTHGGSYWNLAAFRDVNFVDEHERVLTVTPFYHKNSLLNIKSALFGGGSAVVMDGFDAEAVLEAIEQYQVTFLTGVPAIYTALVNAEGALESHDVSSVRVGGCGSDTVPEQPYDRFEEAFGAKLLEGYGLTEGGPMVTTSPRWGVRKRGAAGIPLPGVDTRVVDPETGAELPPGEVGELLVASPGVVSYHERPELTEERFERRDGKRFLHTGDLVKVDDDDYHYIVGRTDDMFVVGGENVYPKEVESVLEGHDAVVEAVVVPVSHEVKGSAPVAFVVAGSEVSTERLRDYALERGPAYAHPRRVYFVDEIPLTSTEKVDRKALETEARNRIDGPL